MEPNGPGVEGLVAGLAEILAGPVVLQDDSFRVLAVAGEGRRLALDPSRCHTTRDALRQVSDGPASGLLEIGGRAPRLVAPVVMGGQLLAYLTVDSVSGGPERRAEIQEVASAVAVELAVERRVSEILGQEEEEFFADLLAGRAPHRILQRGARLGHELTREHIPLAFLLDGRDDLDLPHGLDHLHDLIRSLVRRDFRDPLPIVGRDDEAVVVFLPTTDPQQVLVLAQDTLGGARRKGLGAVAGTGPVCSQPNDFGPAAAKAKWAARVRHIAGHTGLVSSFDDLGVGALLFKIDDRVTLGEYVNRWLGQLKAYDRGHQTQLTQSLRILLETRSLRDSAEALHVHTSTLKYRVKRINEILDAECQDPETAFNLQVALRIDEILEGLR